MGGIFDDYDSDAADRGPTILRQSQHVARKAHPCAGCTFGGIGAGERYTLLVVLDGSEFRLERYCTHKDFDGSPSGCCRDSEGLAWRQAAEREAYEDAAWRERFGPPPGAYDATFGEEWIAAERAASARAGRG